MKLFRFAVLLVLGAALSDAHKLRSAQMEDECVPSEETCSACMSACTAENTECTGSRSASFCRRQHRVCNLKCMETPMYGCC